MSTVSTASQQDRLSVFLYVDPAEKNWRLV